jgi:acetyl-CoA synthetase
MKIAWKPSDEFIHSTRIFQWMKALGFSNYDDFLEASTTNIDWFWHEAEKVLGIQWIDSYKQTLNLDNGKMWPQWYVGGKLNCVGSAVEKWAQNPETSNNCALIWESEQGKVRNYSFTELNEAICRVANGLKQVGLKKGDVISIYMPMIPETVMTILAAAKIGAIFSPVFSGYGADAVATRLKAAKAKIVVTADGFYRRGQAIMMKSEANQAVDMSPSVEKMIVVNVLDSHVSLNKSRDVEWQQIISSEPHLETISMDSSDPLMLLYTSGTTGKPKGAVHTHAGFPIKAAFDAGVGMDVKPGDTIFWYTDMGWMMGPFLIFGGLINGATILMYDGVPDFPDPGRIWEIVDRHTVTHLGISPTLVRSLMKYGVDWPRKHDISRLRVIGSTGEPWNPEPWVWLFEKVGKRNTPIFNYSGGTEISGGILGNVLVRPITPITFNSPLPGMDVDVVDEKGHPILNDVGELVIKKPWVGMTNGFWNDPERFKETYWSRWKDIWVHGDWVIKDSDGFWTITGRSDDTLNIAGKRLGPAEMESILVEHPDIVEAGTIGIPDDVKGEVAVCFVVTKETGLDLENLESELHDLIKRKLGKALKPRSIHFVADLPKTRNAKVMRRAIKSAYLGRDGGDLSALENPETLLEIAALGKQNRLIK